MANILDLDKSTSIQDYEPGININYIGDTIYKIITLVKKFGTYLGLIEREIGDVTQYQLPMKYLNHISNFIFEFDSSYQYIYVYLYNSEQTKTYLKLYLSISDEPTIKYVENDHSNIVPTYSDNNITLKGGAYLINFAHCFMHYIGFNRMRLDDDSYLMQTNSEGLVIKTKLWLYLLLTKGTSWYSKFGYQPANTNINEYLLRISDMKKIRLDEVHSRLKDIINSPNVEYLDEHLVDSCHKLISIIGNSTQTLGEYTLTHSIYEFTDLTNHLTQSIFSKRCAIMDLPTKPCCEDEELIEKETTKELIEKETTKELIEKETTKESIDIESDEESDESVEKEIVITIDELLQHKINISNNKLNQSNEMDSEGKIIYVDFPWYDIYKQLLIANVLQINNNVSNYFYRLPK